MFFMVLEKIDMYANNIERWPVRKEEGKKVNPSGPLNMGESRQQERSAPL